VASAGDAPRRQVSRRDSLAPPVEEFRKRLSRVPLPLARHDNERGQDRLRLLEAHVDLLAETSMPAEGCSWGSAQAPCHGVEGRARVLPSL
jgi:hypothetical protein